MQTRADRAALSSRAMTTVTLRLVDTSTPPSTPSLVLSPIGNIVASSVSKPDGRLKVLAEAKPLPLLA